MKDVKAVHEKQLSKQQADELKCFAELPGEQQYLKISPFPSSPVHCRLSKGVRGGVEDGCSGKLPLELFGVLPTELKQRWDDFQPCQRENPL